MSSFDEIDYVMKDQFDDVNKNRKIIMRWMLFHYRIFIVRSLTSLSAYLTVTTAAATEHERNTLLFRYWRGCEILGNNSITARCDNT